MANDVIINIKANTQNAIKGMTDFKSSLEMIKQVAGTMQRIFDFGLQGAQINQQTASFKTLLNVIGAAPDLLDQLRAASRGTITDMALMTSTSTLLSGASDELALSLAEAAPQILELADAANKLNPTLGSTEFLYSSLMTGIKRGSPLLIDNTGLTIKMGEANEVMAKALGKSVEELTAEEQKMALLNGVLKAGDNLLRQVGGSADSLTDPIETLNTTTTNLANTFKAALAPGISTAATALNTLLTKTEVYLDLTRTHIEEVENTAQSYKEYTDEVRRTLEVTGLQLKAGAFQGEMFKNLNPLLEQSGYNFRVLSEWEWETKRAAEESDAVLKGMSGTLEATSVALANTAGAASAGQSALASYNLALAGVAQLNLDIATAQGTLAEAQAAWTSGAGGQAAGLLDRQKLGTEDYQDALSAIDDVMGTALLTQDQMNIRLQQANDEYAKSRDLEAYKTALEGIKDQFMPLDEKIKAATDSLQILTDKLDALNGRVIDVLINVQQTHGVTIPFFDPNRTPTPTPKPKDDAPYTPLPGGPLNPGMGPTTINVYNQVDSSRAAANVVDAVTRRR